MTLPALSGWQARLAQREDLVFPISVALIAQLLIRLIGALIVLTIPIQHLYENIPTTLTLLEPTGLNVLFAPFQRWDAIWYETIATRGYVAGDSSTAYFPLYPLLIRLFAFGSSATLLVGTLITTLSISAAFVLFYRLASQVFDRRSARFGLIAWATFPTAFFLFVPYAESLFLLFAILSLEAARNRKWLFACLMGGLAALARSPGVWLLAPLGVEWLTALSAQKWQERAKSGALLSLVPLGFLVYMLYLQLQFADPLAFSNAFAAWHNQSSPLWHTFILTVRAIFYGAARSVLNNILDLTTTLFVLAMVVLGLLPHDLRTLSRRGWQPRLPLIYGVYGLVFTLSPLFLIQGDAPLLPMMSAARRAAVIFPAFMVAGTLLHGRFRAPLYFALSAALEVIFLYFFVRWLWVG